ncbi:LOW QUALITY PROTEIN: inverted formin-2-like [Liolophura sinensis]|uniref:LOW QUALITY PROTEIN: inverted formin-2-like n=1 Tax=Liolophura sinensis TaxID=3198878 RepID=UPI0031588EEE
MAGEDVKIVISPAENIPQGKLDSSDQVKMIVQRSGAKGCVSVSHNPSVQVYFALRRKIEQSDDDWLDEFLRLDGLESLLDSLCHMTGKAFTNFSDAILMLDCVCCIRSVLNRQIGLEFVLQQEGEGSLTRKLITALDSGNTLPKKQVFEMLAVICVYGNRGYRVVQDALRHFKKVTNQSHVFSAIVNELKDADTIPYKTAILTLINCVIMGTSDLVDRCRVRTEFEGLQLLDVLNFLRKEDSDEDLSIQLEKFHVHKHRDEEELERRTRVNMTDPHQLVKEVMKKIFATPKEACLVQILQDLLFLSSSSSSEDSEESDAVWNTLKKTVHHLATDKHRSNFTVDPRHGEIIQSGNSPSHTCSCQQDKTLSFREESNKLLASQVVTRARKLFERSSEPEEMVGVVIKNRGRINRYQSSVRPPYTRVKTLRWVPLFQEDMEVVDVCLLSVFMFSLPLNPLTSLPLNPLTSLPLNPLTSLPLNPLTSLPLNPLNSPPMNPLTSLPLNPLTSLPVNPLTSLPLNPLTSLPLTSLPLNPLTSLPLNTLTTPPMNPLTSLPLNPLTSPPMNPLIPPPLNPLTSPPLNPLTSPPLNPLTSSPLNPLTSLPLNPLTSLPLNPLTSPPMNPLTSLPLNPLTSLPMNPLTSLPLNPLNSPPMNPLTSLPLNPLTSLPVNPLTSLPLNPLTSLPLNSPPMNPLTSLPLNPLTSPSDACTLWDREEARSGLAPDVCDLETMFAETGSSFRDFEEIQLLEPSTRLQLNLFLERLDTGVDDLVRSLEREDPLPINLTGLKCLAQVLPCSNEVSAVRKYTGNQQSLGMAEQFLLYLSNVSHYRVLLEGHLTRAEFTSSLNKLKSSLKAQTEACQEILENVSLAKFLHLILDVGNFLNHDKFNGNACGFKLETLARLNHVRSNVPNKTLLHFIVKMSEDRDDTILQFLNDLSHLEKASRMSLEDMKTEVNEMNTRLRKLVQNLAKASTHVRNVFEFFLEDVRQDFANFQSDINSLRQLSHKVAVYFCEDELDFSLQDCFVCLLHFCKQVKKCKEENMLFGRQQRLAVGRMSQLKTHVNKRRVSLEFGREAVASSSFVEDKGQVLENLLTEIHRGNYCPLTPPDLTTPDRENMTFDLDLDCLSPIHQVGSPFKLGETLPPIASVETLNDFTLVNQDNQQDVTVYDVLGEYQQPVDCALQRSIPLDPQHYSRPTTLNLKPTRPDIVMTHPEPPPPPIPAFPPPTKLESVRPVKTHHRSRSDLLEVSTVAEKWVMYEKGRLATASGDQAPAKSKGDNSRHSAIYSMDLEDKGALKDEDDIYLPPGPVVVLPGQEPFKRTKARSSLRNFINKISGGKNKNGSGKDKGKKKDDGRKVTVGEYMKSDKENTVVSAKMSGSQRPKKDNILRMRNK